MALSVMNFGRVRDLVSSLGWKENDNTYALGANCLDVLKSIEEELLNEDVINRNVHISLHICGTVKKDLIPILLYGKNNNILAVATRILVSLSSPVECLAPVEDALLANRAQGIRKQLLAASFEIKTAFLDNSVTFSLVTMLKEAMMKSEKCMVTLTEDDCIHLKNCLMLLRNVLYLPEEIDLYDTTVCSSQNWQFLQNKLMWNLLVQGLDAALLLMLNSKYRVHWTIPLTLIIALLYRNQSITKLHEALELISSASDTSSDEEESDDSKSSSTSLSSEASKISNGLSDSGCALASDTSAVSLSDVNNCIKKQSKFEITEQDYYSFDIRAKLEKVQISDDSESQQNNLKSPFDKRHSSHIFAYGGIDSSYSESPHNKKIKGSTSFDEQISSTDYSSKKRSGIIENMDHNLLDTQGKSSDGLNKRSDKNFMGVQKLCSFQMGVKVLESDSSNEGMQNMKIKYRSPPPAGRRGKNSRRNNGCFPSRFLDSSVAASASKGRIKYPLREKRSSVTTLVDVNSLGPSDEDIGNLIKEFTMSFLHSGFSHLVQDIKNLLLGGLTVTIDKSHFFWILSYFMHLAATVHLNVDQMSNVLNTDVISYLVYECVLACENVELHAEADVKIRKYLFDQLGLVVTALKEIMLTIVLYSKKSVSRKERIFFSDLREKLAHLQRFAHLPLLLFQNCSRVNVQCFTEDVVILNHYILLAIERGMQHFPDCKKFNFAHHLKHFCTHHVVKSYGLLLQNYKYNSNILNECIFTMMHHIAGDSHASDLLVDPSILIPFSRILKEDNELQPYREDLIVYILNKFSLQIQKSHFKSRIDDDDDDDDENGGSSDHSSNSIRGVNRNCLLSEDDDADLFWWNLQFEQDKDPIARISGHISTSKRDKVIEERNELSYEDLVKMDNFDDEITHLLHSLVQSGQRQHLIWIQDTLLETCFVKLGLNTHLPEPVPLYSIQMMTLVPLVPYTEEQKLILKDEMFLQLLKKIGFHLGTGMHPIYPRIPLFWTANVLFTIAARLGPMRKDKLKFSYEELLLADPNNDGTSSRIPPYPALPSLSYTLSSWHAAIHEGRHQKSLS